MKPKKLVIALATFRVEQLLGHRDSNMWHVLALLFNHCVVESYPQRLNQMLLLPLHKKVEQNSPRQLSRHHYHLSNWQIVQQGGDQLHLESDNYAMRAAC